MDSLSIAAEALEREALAELHRGADTGLAGRLGLRLEEVDGALASIAPGMGVVLNRIVGLGVDRAADPATPARLLDLYRQAGAGRFFLHVHPEARPMDLPDHVRSAGFVSARAWRKFRRRPGHVTPRPTDLEIREVGPEHAGDFAAIAGPAFDLAAEAVPLLAGLVGRPGWHVFMSFDEGTPVGTGALYLRDGLAWCDWGATRPEYRKRGSQGALLAHRLQFATEAGCEWIFTCTGEAVPGDPQHSYGNIVKSGFAEWTLRPNYAPPPA